HWPVSSGDSPDGTGRAVSDLKRPQPSVTPPHSARRVAERGGRVARATPVPSGDSPDGTVRAVGELTRPQPSVTPPHSARRVAERGGRVARATPPLQGSNLTR